MQTNNAAGGGGGRGLSSFLRRFGVGRWLSGFAAYVWSWVAPWIPNLLSLSGGSGSDGLTGSSSTAPSGARFTARFEQRYGAVHPAFVQGSYDEACQQARAQFRLLVVYLHSERHPLAARFCRDVLTQPTLAAWLDEHCVVWAASVLDADAWSLSSAMGCSGYPFVAVAVCGNALGGVTVVERLEGALCVHLDTLRQRLQAALEQHAPLLLQSRFEAEERARDRTLRDEQDAEYQQALEEDQRRERERRQQQQREQQEHERRLQLERDEQRRRDEIARRRDQLRARLPPEPAAGGPSGSTALLAIRLSDGSRLQRRFNASDPIQVVRDFVDAWGYDGPEPPDQYDLVSNFPRRTFSDARQTLADAGLVPTGQLFISDISDLLLGSSTATIGS